MRLKAFGSTDLPPDSVAMAALYQSTEVPNFSIYLHDILLLHVTSDPLHNY